jgi:hypothetical protein
MHVFASIWDKGILRGALALSVVLVAATAPAENLRVTAANSVGNSLYDVTAFAPPPATSGGTLSLLNSDGGSHGSFSSVVLVPNLVTGTVDALVADLTGPPGAAGGQILRYTPALGTTQASVTIVWRYNGSGPINPDGLSLDSLGNLFIVSSKPPQVWVLPVSAVSPTGFADAPLLIHATFPTGQGVLQLQDTVVAKTTSTVWQPDDLLLMVGNKNSTSNQNTNNDDVYLYKALTIHNVIAGSGPVSAPDQILINGTQFPLGEYGLGLDIWPGDSANPNPTLLVLTTAGNILQWDFNVSPLTSTRFATGLGTGLAKLKVGRQLETLYAYVTQALPSGPTGSGRILQLGATSGVLNIVGTLATPAVMSPDGLAVAPLGAATADSCKAINGGCDISGTPQKHVILHKVTVSSGASNPTGNVIEATCVVPQDPRVPTGQCPGTPLDVSTVCPGFGHEIIPGTLCGGSGVTGHGFAVVRTNATGVDSIAGILVTSEANVDNILPPLANQTNPLCPSNAYAWAPFSDASPSEGIAIPSNQLVEMTSYCGTSGGSNRGMSVYAVGLIYLPQGTLAADALQKYTDLSTTVDSASANIVPNTKSSLDACLSPIQTYIGQADYACAATQTVRCNTQVASDQSPAKHYLGTSGPSGNPNPWGEIQGRLGNIYMQVNTRLQGNPVNHAWPLGSTDVQPSCAAPVVVSFTASPSTVVAPGSAQLSWSTLHATSCQLSGFSGSQPASGSLTTGSLSSTKNYALTCTGISGTVKSSLTVHVSK